VAGLGFLWAGAASAQNAPSPRDAYLVNSGDVLAVIVWKEEDLQREVIVRPDGMFSFPLAGEIRAQGRSVEQIRAAIAQSLSRYIPDPVVTVSTEQILGNKIYVIGQVNRPGEFVVNPQVDVMQALSLAGGTTPFADLNSIRILRRSGAQQRAIGFNYGEVEKGKRLEQNIVLQPGDVLVVP
jgi:polysaccharide export outer membrane protein